MEQLIRRHGLDRLLTSPLCSASESPKPSGGGRIGTMKEAFKSQYLSKFRKSSDSIGTTSSVGSGGVQSSMQEQWFRRFFFITFIIVL